MTSGSYYYCPRCGHAWHWHDGTACITGPERYACDCTICAPGDDK